MTRIIVFLLAWCAAGSVFGATAPDLRSRITIDGLTYDFESDEWVVDSATVFREGAGDSRWGRDNDIQAIALTWDFFNLYVAVPAVTTSGTLMLAIDTMCGGAANLTNQVYFSRNVEFGGMTPNFLLRVARIASGPLAGYRDCTRPFNLFEDDRYRSVYLQDGVTGGALEVALPWEILGDFAFEADGVRLPSKGDRLSVVAFVTGGEGTGAGDAAPDPSVALDNDSTRVAILDNHVIVPLDADEDGWLDPGVSPRAVASFRVSGQAQGTAARQPLAFSIPLGEKLFSPLRDAEARFPVVLGSPEYTEPVTVTARVYSSAGEVVRTLVAETPIDFSSGAAELSWDFKDDFGRLVPGGVYILAVSGGPGTGAPKATAKAAFAVVR